MALSMLNLRENCPFILFLLMSMVLRSTLADVATDKEECTQQLLGMATCLPYVGGDAKAPTPDCCNGLKEVLKTNKKCLCVIIRDRNDPDLDLQINVSLALGLPNACHAPANVSKCPELLNLPPDSPEARVFYQLGNGSSTPAGSSYAPAPGLSGAGNSVSANSEGATSSGSRNGSEKSEASIKQKRWSELETVLIGGVLIWVFVEALYDFVSLDGSPLFHGL